MRDSDTSGCTPVFIPIKYLMNMMVRNAYRSRPEITKKPQTAKRKTEIVSRHATLIGNCPLQRCITRYVTHHVARRAMIIIDFRICGLNLRKRPRRTHGISRSFSNDSIHGSRKHSITTFTLVRKSAFHCLDPCAYRIAIENCIVDFLFFLIVTRIARRSPDFFFLFFYFVLGIITSCHFA